MNLRIITKNRGADPEIGFLTKSILKPYGRAAAMPTAWELTNLSSTSSSSTDSLTSPVEVRSGHSSFKMFPSFRTPPTTLQQNLPELYSSCPQQESGSTLSGWLTLTRDLNSRNSLRIEVNSYNIDILNHIEFSLIQIPASRRPSISWHEILRPPFRGCLVGWPLALNHLPPTWLISLSSSTVSDRLKIF